MIRSRLLLSRPAALLLIRLCWFAAFPDFWAVRCCGQWARVGSFATSLTHVISSFSLNPSLSPRPGGSLPAPPTAYRCLPCHSLTEKHPARNRRSPDRSEYCADSCFQANTSQLLLNNVNIPKVRRARKKMKTINTFDNCNWFHLLFYLNAVAYLAQFIENQHIIKVFVQSTDSAAEFPPCGGSTTQGSRLLTLPCIVSASSQSHGQWGSMAQQTMS